MGEKMFFPSYRVTINENSTVIQPRINGDFTVNRVNTIDFSPVVDRNNVFSADLWLTPISFGGNHSGLFTSVDIIVTWMGAGGNTHTFRDVVMEQTVIVRLIPWNAGQYQVLVKANGPDGTMGTVTLHIYDMPA